MKCIYSAAALAALMLAGMGQAKADILCPNLALQGGFGGTFAPAAGDNDGVCGSQSGVALSLSVDTNYAKLMWNTASSPSGPSSQLLPGGITLGNLQTVEANVNFTADTSDVSPYFILSFSDPTNVISGHAAGDQILMLEFENLGLNGAGPSTMTLDGNTVFNFYDNTTGHYLLGGQQDKASLTTWLTANAGLSGAAVDGIWIAEGLGGSCAAGGCSESLTVSSAEFSATPEPGTIALFFGGFAGLVALRRRFAL
ncbi:MAG TPA: PEP-CTERM sorting domain-containing protein [Bryobacteraceae bacterium]|nr:PEP-CTERM sorting domain-containing protein [Bryobacteraceae bacterium]